MQGTRALLVAVLTVAVAAPLGPEHARSKDPLEEVIVALDQGRHWHAARLLRDLDGTLSDPRAPLLAAKADAGRGDWSAVARRLEAAAWIDSVAYGEGRALLARAWLELGDDERAVQSYEMFLQNSLERVPRAFAEIGLARSLGRLGRPAEAARAYSRAAEAAPELASPLSMRAAESLAAIGDTAGTRRTLQHANAAPHNRRINAEVSALENAGDSDRALRVLLDAAESPASGERSAAFRAHAARILLAVGDSSAATGVLRAAVRTASGSALEPAELLAQLPNLKPDDHYRLARVFERAGAARDAAREYATYLETVKPSEAERQRLSLKIGELLFEGGAYFACVAELERLLSEQPPTAIAAQAEYFIARATYRQGWRQEGRQRLREIADRYAGSAAAMRALLLLGDLYDGAGDSRRARLVYQELSDRYAGSRVGRTARYRLGLLDYMAGDHSTAAVQFDRLRRSERSPHLLTRAVYWAAKAREAEGRPERLVEAERLFQTVYERDPYGYYGLRAADRLGIDPWEGLSEGPEPSALDPATRELFSVLDLLRRAGLHEETAELRETIIRSRKRSPTEMLGLSRALAESGYGEDAVRLGWSAHARLQGRWSASLLRAIYPLAFREIILAESESSRLDPHLVAAIVRQESAFDPEATSRAGARGLLQIMPNTGRWLADRLRIGDFSVDLLYHPELNVHMGTAYFADLQRRYSDLQLALIAYNAGPTRAARWQHRSEYQIDDELFAERLPFSETRNYVRAIQSHVRIYRALYTDLHVAKPAD